MTNQNIKKTLSEEVCSAPEITFGNEVQLSSTNVNATDPAAAYFNGGGYVATWKVLTSATIQVIAQIFYSNNIQSGSQITVISHPWVGSVDVGTFSDKSFIVVYSTLEHSRAAWQIRCQYYIYSNDHYQLGDILQIQGSNHNKGRFSFAAFDQGFILATMLNQTAIQILKYNDSMIAPIFNVTRNVCKSKQMEIEIRISYENILFTYSALNNRGIFVELMNVYGQMVSQKIIHVTPSTISTDVLDNVFLVGWEASSAVCQQVTYSAQVFNVLNNLSNISQIIDMNSYTPKLFDELGSSESFLILPKSSLFTLFELGFVVFSIRFSGTSSYAPMLFGQLVLFSNKNDDSNVLPLDPRSGETTVNIISEGSGCGIKRNILSGSPVEISENSPTTLLSLNGDLRLKLATESKTKTLISATPEESLSISNLISATSEVSPTLSIGCKKNGQYEKVCGANLDQTEHFPKLADNIVKTILIFLKFIRDDNKFYIFTVEMAGPLFQKFLYRNTDQISVMGQVLKDILSRFVPSVQGFMNEIQYRFDCNLPIKSYVNIKDKIISLCQNFDLLSSPDVAISIFNTGFGELIRDIFMISAKSSNIVSFDDCVKTAESSLITTSSCIQYYLESAYSFLQCDDGSFFKVCNTTTSNVVRVNNQVDSLMQTLDKLKNVRDFYLLPPVLQDKYSKILGDQDYLFSSQGVVPWSIVLNLINKMDQYISDADHTGRFLFDYTTTTCQANDNGMVTFGYVTSGGKFAIHLCAENWLQQSEFPTAGIIHSQFGTVTHELSHLIGGTTDKNGNGQNVYGVVSCKEWSSKHPMISVYKDLVADCFSLFIAYAYLYYNNLIFDQDFESDMQNYSNTNIIDQENELKQTSVTPSIEYIQVNDFLFNISVIVFSKNVSLKLTIKNNSPIDYNISRGVILLDGIGSGAPFDIAPSTFCDSIDNMHSKLFILRGYETVDHTLMLSDNCIFESAGVYNITFNTYFDLYDETNYENYFDGIGSNKFSYLIGNTTFELLETFSQSSSASLSISETDNLL